MSQLTCALLWLLSLLLVTRGVFAMVLFNATDLGILLEKYQDDDGDWAVGRQRGKRAITASDMQAILDLHNKLRGQVYPAASNMEYMVWQICLWNDATYKRMQGLWWLIDNKFDSNFKQTLKIFFTLPSWVYWYPPQKIGSLTSASHRPIYSTAFHKNKGNSMRDALQAVVNWVSGVEFV